MLQQRLLTALVLCILLAWSLFFAPPLVAQATVALLAIGGCWEWSALMQLTSLSKRIAYLLCLVAGFIIIQLTSPMFILYVASGFWLLASFFLIKFSHRQQWIFSHITAQAVLGLVILLAFWVGIAYLLSSAQYQFIVLLLLTIVISADTGAYFAGKRWGQHALAPAISPNKTLEGVVGGVLLATLTAGLLCYLFHQSTANSIFYTVTALLTGLLSVVGDLLESAMKRQARVKDSGYLFPGHGGILDRIDGYTAAVPFFTLMVVFLQRGLA